MKKAVVIALNRPAADKCSLEWREAFCEGLRRRGWDVQMSTDAKPCDLLVMWGTRRQDVIARQKAVHGQVCILERGYLGDRRAWTSVSFGGGLNGRGEFRGPHQDGSRFQKHFSHLLKDWHQPEGGYALLMGQVPGDQSIRNVDIGAFYAQSAKALQNYGWPDVRFRPHPQAGRVRGSCGNSGMKIIEGDLHDAMSGAGVVMTFNSNTGVDAAMFGRPVIAMDEGSMAWPVAGHQVTEIAMPDRTAWAHRLAWCQWTKQEFLSGECQEAVGL
jgi:hypothetical protein